MRLVLHEMAHSPFCIPIRRLLEAHDIPYAIHPVAPWDRRDLARLTGGAYYQVPVIEHDGRVIHETPADPLAVPHYLDARFLGEKLFPPEWAGVQEILIDHIENTLEGLGFKISDPQCIDSLSDLGERIMVVRHKERRFGPGCVEAWREGAPALIAALESALAPYEARLGHSDWLLGNRPLYADYALFGVLGNFQYGGHHRLSARFENLHRWLDDLTGYTANLGPGRS